MIPVPVHQPDDSARLLARIAKGDEDAFRELYEAVAPAAYGLALRVTRDEHLAQDVLQETFAQVWSTADRYDPAIASGRAWVTVLTHRRAVDRVRQEQSDRRRVTTWAVATHEPDHDHVAAVVDLRAEHRSVRHALNSLTALQREALELAYFNGLTYQQVATHLDIPLGTAKTRIRDALKALRVQMEDHR
jgi:RNA polymerase sigma-70 factor (ECF subfamily)